MRISDFRIFPHFTGRGFGPNAHMASTPLPLLEVTYLHRIMLWLENSVNFNVKFKISFKCSQCTVTGNWAISGNIKNHLRTIWSWKHWISSEKYAKYFLDSCSKSVIDIVSNWIGIRERFNSQEMRVGLGQNLEWCTLLTILVSCPSVSMKRAICDIDVWNDWRCPLQS